MEDLPAASQAPANAVSGGGVSPRDQLAKQIAGSGSPAGDGGLFSQLAGNPFFTAGFGLAGLGAALALAQRGVRHGAALLKRRLLVDVEISRTDESYQWFLHWMTQYQRAQLSESTTTTQRLGLCTRLLKRLTPGLHHLSIQTTKTTLPNGSTHTHFSLIPGPGHHILRYGSSFISIQRNRDSKAHDLTTGQPWETITLTTLYTHRQIFESLFRDAHALATRATEGKLILYTAWSTEWRPFGQPRRKRPLDSVILDKGITSHLIEDIKSFLQSAKWYHDRGIPYRRGYLLHGPPGSGKTSFIQALAGSLDCNIALLHLGERGLTDDRLTYLLSNLPPRTIVLLEDVDAAFAARRAFDGDQGDGYTGPHVTFSGLLNALDGVASSEERIVFLTTNFVNRLDPALVRPGRVDVSVRLGEATRFQAGELWDRFFEGEEVGKERFLEELEKWGLLGKVSTAGLQGLFLRWKGDVEGAVGGVEELAEAMGVGRRIEGGKEAEQKTAIVSRKKIGDVG